MIHIIKNNDSVISNIIIIIKKLLKIKILIVIAHAQWAFHQFHLAHTTQFISFQTSIHSASVFTPAEYKCPQNL